MLLVPLKGDKVRFEDFSDEFTVKSFTSLKVEPVVYLTTELPTGEAFVAISMIKSINGVPVIEKDTVLAPKGPVKRKYNLPQPGDRIKVQLRVNVQGISETAELEVTELHLKADPMKPLMIKTKDGAFSLRDVLDIKRKIGGEAFTKEGFLRYYLDYLPIKRS